MEHNGGVGIILQNQNGPAGQSLEERKNILSSRGRKSEERVRNETSGEINIFKPRKG